MAKGSRIAEMRSKHGHFDGAARRGNRDGAGFDFVERPLPMPRGALPGADSIGARNVGAVLARMRMGVPLQPGQRARLLRGGR